MKRRSRSSLTLVAAAAAAFVACRGDVRQPEAERMTETFRQSFVVGDGKDLGVPFLLDIAQPGALDASLSWEVTPSGAGASASSPVELSLLLSQPCFFTGCKPVVAATGPGQPPILLSAPVRSQLYFLSIGSATRCHGCTIRVTLAVMHPLGEMRPLPWCGYWWMFAPTCA